MYLEKQPVQVVKCANKNYSDFPFRHFIIHGAYNLMFQSKDAYFKYQ